MKVGSYSGVFSFVNIPICARNSNQKPATKRLKLGVLIWNFDRRGSFRSRVDRSVRAAFLEAEFYGPLHGLDFTLLTQPIKIPSCYRSLKRVEKLNMRELLLEGALLVWDFYWLGKLSYSNVKNSIFVFAPGFSKLTVSSCKNGFTGFAAFLNLIHGRGL